MSQGDEPSRPEQVDEPVGMFADELPERPRFEDHVWEEAMEQAPTFVCEEGLETSMLEGAPTRILARRRPRHRGAFEAGEAFERAIELAQQVEDPRADALWRVGLGVVLNMRGAAPQSFARALELVCQVEDESLVGYVQGTLGALEWKIRERPRAL